MRCLNCVVGLFFKITNVKMKGPNKSFQPKKDKTENKNDLKMAQLKKFESL